MLMELLASHGYVVISIAHTYENIVTLLNEHEVIPGNLEHLFTLFDAHADQEEALYQEFRKTADRETRYDLVRQILAVDDQFTRLLKIRTEDVRMVLKALQQWNNTDSIFRSGLDMNRVGILGWSFGGATALEGCMADSTIKAGINLDGYPYGPHFASGEIMRQPFMLIQSASDDIMEDMVGRLQMERAANAKYFLVIEGAQHLNFWDFPYFFKIYKTIDFWGPIDPMQMLTIEEAYVVGFFDRYLKGKEVNVLEQTSSPFPEVKIVTEGP
jgi:predicted dienelactone hydrolase